MRTPWGIILACWTLIPVFASCPLGTPQRRGSDPVPGQKALLRRVQVSQVQEKMDERELLGQYGAGVHQVSHQRVPTQAGEPGEGWGSGKQVRRKNQGRVTVSLTEPQFAPSYDGDETRSIQVSPFFPCLIGHGGERACFSRKGRKIKGQLYEDPETTDPSEF